MLKIPKKFQVDQETKVRDADDKSEVDFPELNVGTDQEQFMAFVHCGWKEKVETLEAFVLFLQEMKEKNIYQVWLDDVEQEWFRKEM